jgi:hypothetical protein
MDMDWISHAAYATLAATGPDRTDGVIVTPCHLWISHTSQHRS